jgi:AAA lid domain/ATPase family associated with various cellular activities (AAA)
MRCGRGTQFQSSDHPQSVHGPINVPGGCRYHPAVAGALAKYVDAFVDGVSADLSELSGRDHRREVVLDAGDLVAAVIDSDSRRSVAELEAWLDDIGPRLDPPVIVTSDRLRDSAMLEGKGRWLEQPSTLADLVLRADARDGGRRAARYYDLAIRLAHAAASVDLVPSPDEVAAIDRYRGVLLAAFDAAGVTRPGRPGTATPAGDGPRPAATPPSEAPPPELPPERPIEELLAELDELVGLHQVKADVRRLSSLLRIQKLREERGLPTLETSHHLVFTGNPGTGKTTVARMLSQILRALDVVSTGHLVETDRSHLVAGYVGQTAVRTRQVLESALGGTLLIDEAYALARGGETDFGREAIDTLVKLMEDHRDDLAVVAAGYTDEMVTFIATNPGLRSRFTRTIEFADYTDDELIEIFVRMGEANRYLPTDGAIARLRSVLAATPRDKGFGNARFIRNIFEAAVSRQASRLVHVDEPDPEQLTTLVADDLPAP